MPLYGGIDLGGTKIQTVIVDDDHKVLGSARHPTPTSGGPQDVAAEMVARPARRGQGCGDRAGAAGWDRGRLAGDDRGRKRHQRAQPARLGRHVPAGGHAEGRARAGGRGRQRRAGRHRRGAEARRGPAVQLAAGRVLGNGGWRWADPRRQALDRTWGCRRDRAYGCGDRRRALHVRASGLHGGLCRARGDGNTRAQAARGEGTQDRPVQADARTRTRRG